MMKLQQTAVCPVCFDGLPDGCDIDNYEANWKYWHEHSLGLEQHSEEWVLWQKKEPIVTHEVEGSNTVTKHWLCRECVYRHDHVRGTFSILIAPSADKSWLYQVDTFARICHPRRIRQLPI